MNITQKTRSRFETKVDIGKTNECWKWKASTLPAGYGRLWVNGKTVGAHRVSWEIYNGPIPVGRHVLHTCDNPTCVNPSHMFLGDWSENAADREAKGRGAPHDGERNSQCKLSTEDVIKIREMRSYGYKVREVAQSFGISEQHVSSITTCKRWVGRGRHG